MPVTIRPSMKQSKCKHPATAILRGTDELYETCTRCGIVRASHYDAPWILDYNATEATKQPEDLVLISLPIPTVTRKRRRQRHDPTE